MNLFKKLFFCILILIALSIIVPAYKMGAREYVSPPICTPSCGFWDSCSVSCGGGTQDRTCTRDDCSSYSESQSCNTQTCPPTPITVNVIAEPSTINSGDKTNIKWESTGATSCTPPAGYESAGTGITENFTTSPLYTNTTFTVTCTTDAYCSGTYEQKIGPGTTFDNMLFYGGSYNGVFNKLLYDLEGSALWEEGTTYFRGYYMPGEPQLYYDTCLVCDQAGVKGYRVTGSSWNQHTCVQNRFIFCWGVRWSKGSSYVGPAYVTKGCGGESKSFCTSHSGCIWNP